MGVAHFSACANPLTLFLSKRLIFALCHDGAERVLGSKLLKNELFWTTEN